MYGRILEISKPEINDELERKQGGQIVSAQGKICYHKPGGYPLGVRTLFLVHLCTGVRENDLAYYEFRDCHDCQFFAPALFCFSTEATRHEGICHGNGLFIDWLTTEFSDFFQFDQDPFFESASLSGKGDDLRDDLFL
jgi:hypothetical protein